MDIPTNFRFYRFFIGFACDGSAIAPPLPYVRPAWSNTTGGIRPASALRRRAHHRAWPTSSHEPKVRGHLPRSRSALRSAGVSLVMSSWGLSSPVLLAAGGRPSQTPCGSRDASRYVICFFLVRFVLFE